jgi:CheY-like chemotaxis protein
MGSLSRARILVADDELDIRIGLQNILEDSFEAEVETAASGQEALNFLRKHAFDLLVTDFRMPNMDGVQLADAARSLQPSLRILMVTAFDRELVARLGSRARNARILQKPLEPSAVLAAVQRSLAAP